MSNLISRQAAIKGVKTLHDVAWKNWHEPTLSANVVLDMIRELPSVQPKIIRCKNCKWRNNQDGATGWLPCRALVTPSDFYCGWAELRGDSDDNH